MRKFKDGYGLDLPQVETDDANVNVDVTT